MKAAGRWNRPGVYGCLYTALTASSAIAEFRKLLARYGADPVALAPRDLVTIDVQLYLVCDLRSPRVRRTVGVDLRFLRGDRAESLDACRAVADWARGEGFVALLAPSAAAADDAVLAIYPDMHPASGIRLTAGSERRPLNYGDFALLP